MRRRRISMLLLLLALLLGACGDAADVADEPNPVEDVLTKPVVTVPDGPPPTELVINDLIEGDGATLEPGGQATVQYVGVSYSTGEQFDASWDRGQPFKTEIPGRVIEGWNEGMLGMKVGGRRELIIPADKAYGNSPPPSSAIAPGETLIFVIDLVDVG